MATRAKARRATFQDIDARLETVEYPRNGEGEWIPRDVHIKTMSRGEWEALRDDDDGWGGVALEDGRTLAVKIEPRNEVTNERGWGYSEPSQWVEDVKALRRLLFDAIEGDPRCDYMDLTLIGNGCARFSVEFNESSCIQVVIRRDPDA